MKNPLFVDISEFQDPTLVDWRLYATFSLTGDGIPRLVARASQGIGVPDKAFLQHWHGAAAAGITARWAYHYAYPNLHPGAAGAQAEAQYFASVIGPELLAGDGAMLDLEQNESNAWALAFGQELLNVLPGLAGNLILYDSLSHIQAFLTDPALPGIYKLAVASWTFDPLNRPPCPAPWQSYEWVQYSDKESIPGMPGLVDSNVWTGGGNVGIPNGWQDDGTTLTAPNGVPVISGFRAWVLAHNWTAENHPLAAEYAVSSVEPLVNPATGAGSRQDFHECSLGYTASRGAFTLWIGDEIAARALQEAKAQAWIDSLQGQVGSPLADAAKKALQAWLSA